MHPLNLCLARAIVADEHRAAAANKAPQRKPRPRDSRAIHLPQRALVEASLLMCRRTDRATHGQRKS